MRSLSLPSMAMAPRRTRSRDLVGDVRAIRHRNLSGREYAGQYTDLAPDPGNCRQVQAGFDRRGRRRLPPHHAGLAGFLSPSGRIAGTEAAGPRASNTWLSPGHGREPVQRVVLEDRDLQW